MKHIFFIGLLLFPLSLFALGPYPFLITRAIDGDTFEFVMPGLPDELGENISLRIYGIDAPETGARAKCESERKRGEKAKKFANEIIDTAADLNVSIMKWDKYGGRVLGDVLVNGISYRKIILEKNLATEYYGDSKKSWCK